MAAKTPLKALFDNDGNPTSLAEYTADDWLRSDDGGTGYITYSNGEILIGNSSGSLSRSSLTGTSNQITITNSSGGIQISLPQNIHTSAEPTFAGLTINGVGLFTGNVCMESNLVVDGSTTSKSFLCVESNLDVKTTSRFRQSVDIDANLNVDGTAVIDSTLDVGGNTALAGCLKTTDKVRLGSTDDPLRSLHIAATDGLVLPVGTTVQRESTAITGEIRFNSTSIQFEGYDGTAWGSLGGVIDVDQDTYISAETSASTDNDELIFYTAGTERGKICDDGALTFAGATSLGSTLSITSSPFVGNSTGSTTTITLLSGNTTGLSAGQVVYYAPYGNFTIDSITDSTHFVLTTSPGAITAGAIHIHQNPIVDINATSIGPAVDISQSNIGIGLKLTHTGTTGDLVNIIDGSTERFTILQGGNVGINQATPACALDVTGTFRATGNSTIGGTLDVTDAVNLNDTTTSTTSTSGALIVDGGVGIAENVNVGGNAIITGNLTVNGTTTTVNSTTLTVDDKNIELAHSPSGSEGNDASIDGGGITLKSSNSDKTILWTDATDSWDFNQHVHVTGNVKASTSVCSPTVCGSTLICGANLCIDNINVNANTISTTNTNGDLTITPAGTGCVNITKAVDIDTTLNVDGATTITGATALNGGLTMDTDKFTVADGTGNTTIAGTLGVTGNTTIGGNLTVNGTTTTVNSTTLTIDDKNIELAHSPSGSEGDDTAVDGGGITLKSSDSDKTITWTNSSDSWDFNQKLYVSQAGTAKSGIVLFDLTNTINAADMDDTTSSIQFNQYYYDATTPAKVDSAKITVGTECDWTSTAATQDSYMSFSTGLDGTVAEKVRIDSDGKVGIGTTEPAEKLHIAAAGKLKLSRSDNTRHACIFVNDSGLRFTNDGGDPFHFVSEAYIDFWSCGCSSRAMRINGESVGIGGTISPQAALDVKTSGATNASMRVSYGGDNNHYMCICPSLLHMVRGPGSGAKFEFCTSITSGSWAGNADAGDFVFVNKGTTTMNIAEGCVGIGTDSPNSCFKLDVRGGENTAEPSGISVRNEGAALHTGLYITHNSINSSWGANQVTKEGSWYKLDNACPSIGWITSGNYSGVSSMEIKASDAGQSSPLQRSILFVCGTGNVGIGTTTPNDVLDVHGDSGQLLEAADDFSDVIFSANTISGLPVIEACCDNTVTLGRYNRCDFVIQGSDGKVGIGTTAPGSKLSVAGAVSATGGILGQDTGFSSTIPIWGISNSYLATDYGITYVEGSPDEIRIQGGGVVNHRFGMDTGNAYLAIASGCVGIGTASPNAPLMIDDDSHSLIRVVRTGNANGRGIAVAFAQCNNAGEVFETGQIMGVSDDNTNGSEDGHIRLRVMSNGSIGCDILTACAGGVGIGETVPTSKLHVCGDYNLARFHTTRAGSDGVYLDMDHLSTSPADADNMGYIRFRGYNDAGTPEVIMYGTIDVCSSDISDGTEDGMMKLRTIVGGVDKCTVLITNDQVQIGSRDTGCTAQTTLDVAGTSNFGGNVYFSWNKCPYNQEGYSHTIAHSHSGSTVTSNWLDFRIWKSGTSGTPAGEAQSVMRLRGDGNVGIGTITPNDVLEVHGDSGQLLEAADDFSDVIFSANTISGLPVIEACCDNTVTLGKYNRCDFVIQGSTGYIGIGTNSPVYPVDICRTISENSYISIENNTVANAGIRMKNSQGEWIIIANDRLRIYDVDSSAERMSILSDGNVGIGTTVPRTKFEINQPESNALHTNTLRIGGCRRGLQTHTGSTIQTCNSIVFGGYRDVVLDTVGAKIVAEGINNASNSLATRTSLKFYTGHGSYDGNNSSDDSVLAMTMQYGGNVGIGTASPLSKLHIVDTLNATGMQLYSCKSITSNAASYNSALFIGQGLGGISSGVANSGYDYSLNIQRLGLTSLAGTLATQGGISVQYGMYSGTGTITDAYGIIVSPYHTTGTVTNSYGVYISSISGSGGANTCKYGLYQADTTVHNYFGGHVGIGITTPNRPLHVCAATTSIDGLHAQATVKSTGTLAGIELVNTAGKGMIQTNSGCMDFWVDNQTTGNNYVTSTDKIMTLKEGGCVGIGTDIPRSALSIPLNKVFSQGDQGTTAGFTWSASLDTGYFTNGSAGGLVYLCLGNIQYWGWIEVTVAGSYSYQQARGILSKRYVISRNTDGTWLTAASQCPEVTASHGEVPNNIHLGDWIGASGESLRLPIYHTVSSGNEFTVHVKGSNNTPGTPVPVMGSIAYAQHSVTTREYKSISNRLGIGHALPAVPLDIRHAGAGNGSSQEIVRMLNTTAGAYSAYMYIGGGNGTDWKIGKNPIGTATRDDFGITTHAGTADLFTILTTGEVGISEVNPDHSLHISESSENVITALDWCANDTAGATLALRKNRGNSQVIYQGNAIGELGFYTNPLGDTNRPNIQTSGILVCATCSYGCTNSVGYNHPSEMIFKTTQEGAGNTAAEKMRLTHAGRLGINTPTPNTFLHVHEDSSANAYLLVTNCKTGQASYGAVQSLGGIVDAADVYTSIGSSLTTVNATGSMAGSGLKVIITDIQDGKPSKLSIDPANAGSDYSDGDYVKIIESGSICDSCVQIKRTGADGFLVGIDGRQNAKIWNNEDRAIIFGANGCDRFRVSRTGAIGVGVVNSGVPSSLFVNADGSNYTTGTNCPVTGGNGSDMTVDITASGGDITCAVINQPGSGYCMSDLVTVSGGTGGTLRIDEIDDPDASLHVMGQFRGLFRDSSNNICKATSSTSNRRLICIGAAGFDHGLEIGDALQLPTLTSTWSDTETFTVLAVVDNCVCVDKNPTFALTTAQEGFKDDNIFKIQTGDNRELITVDSSGNLGINVDNPEYKLDVSGKARFRGALSTLIGGSSHYLNNSAATKREFVFNTASNQHGLLFGDAVSLPTGYIEGCLNLKSSGGSGTWKVGCVICSNSGASGGACAVITTVYSQTLLGYNTGMDGSTSFFVQNESVCTNGQSSGAICNTSTGVVIDNRQYETRTVCYLGSGTHSANSSSTGYLCKFVVSVDPTNTIASADNLLGYRDDDSLIDIQSGDGRPRFCLSKSGRLVVDGEPEIGHTGVGQGTLMIGQDNRLYNTQVNADNIVKGSTYKILSSGNTTWSSLGAANNNVGTVFEATAAGTGSSGTGTALFGSYVKNLMFDCSQIQARNGISTSPLTLQLLGKPGVSVGDTRTTHQNEVTGDIINNKLLVKGNARVEGDLSVTSDFQVQGEQTVFTTQYIDTIDTVRAVFLSYDQPIFEEAWPWGCGADNGGSVSMTGMSVVSGSTWKVCVSTSDKPNPFYSVGECVTLSAVGGISYSGDTIVGQESPSFTITEVNDANSCFCVVDSNLGGTYSSGSGVGYITSATITGGKSDLDFDGAAPKNIGDGLGNIGLPMAGVGTSVPLGGIGKFFNCTNNTNNRYTINSSTFSGVSVGSIVRLSKCVSSDPNHSYCAVTAVTSNCCFDISGTVANTHQQEVYLQTAGVGWTCNEEVPAETGIHSKVATTSYSGGERGGGQGLALDVTTDANGTVISAAISSSKQSGVIIASINSGGTSYAVGDRVSVDGSDDAGKVISISVAAGGAGYAIGDTFTIAQDSGGTDLATGEVTAVNSGAATVVSLTYAGSGYDYSDTTLNSATKATTKTSGSGNNALTVNVTIGNAILEVTSVNSGIATGIKVIAEGSSYEKTFNANTVLEAGTSSNGLTVNISTSARGTGYSNGEIVKVVDPAGTGTDVYFAIDDILLEREWNVTGTNIDLDTVAGPAGVNAVELTKDTRIESKGMDLQYYYPYMAGDVLGGTDSTSQTRIFLKALVKYYSQEATENIKVQFYDGTNWNDIFSGENRLSDDLRGWHKLTADLTPFISKTKGKVTKIALVNYNDAGVIQAIHGGTGNSNATGVGTGTSSSGGTGLTIDTVVTSGSVTGVTINAVGSNYEEGDIVQIGSTGAYIKILQVDTDNKIRFEINAGQSNDYLQVADVIVYESDVPTQLGDVFLGKQKTGIGTNKPNGTLTLGNKYDSAVSMDFRANDSTVVSTNYQDFSTARIHAESLDDNYSGKKLHLQLPTGENTWKSNLVLYNGCVGIGTCFTETDCQPAPNGTSTGDGLHVLGNIRQNNNSLLQSTSILDRRHEQSLFFDGAHANYVSVADDAALDFGADIDFSLEAWVKTNSSSECGYIINKYSSGGYGFQLEIMPDGILQTQVVAGSSGKISCITNSINDGRWHHVVATFTRNAPNNCARIYIDGVEANYSRQDSLPSGNINNGMALTIGKSSFSNLCYFQGEMSSVRVFNYTLSHDDIASLYNGKPVDFAEKGGTGEANQVDDGDFSESSGSNNFTEWERENRNATISWTNSNTDLPTGYSCKIIGTPSNGSSGVYWDSVLRTHAANNTLSFSAKQKVRISFFAKSGSNQSSGDADARSMRVRLVDDSTSDFAQCSAGGGDVVIDTVWRKYHISFDTMFASDASTGLNLEFQVGNSDTPVHLTGVEFRRIGVVVELLPEGMSSSAYGSQWYDSSGNDLHGTIWSSWMDKERHLSPNYGFKTCNNGCFSSVFGYRGRTNGDYASAFGFCAEATQCCSTAVGYCADVTYGYTNSTLYTGVGASAFGFCVSACGCESSAVGYCTKVSGTGDWASAFGYKSDAAGCTSTAIGACILACGCESSAVGYKTCATHDRTSSGGYVSQATGQFSTSWGYCAVASGVLSVAVGNQTLASGVNSTALGQYAKARVGCTTNIGGALITKKDDGEGEDYAFREYSSAEITLMTKNIDLETVDSHDITVPSGSTFYISEMGVIITDWSSVVTQPTIRIGNSSDDDKQLDDIQLSSNLSGAGKRVRFLPALPDDGESLLRVCIVNAANATTMKGRFYFKGMLVENQ